MTELISNIFQFTALFCCAVCSGIMAFYKQNRIYLLASCFYGSFALGLLYWCIYLYLGYASPLFFSIADMSWIASFTFLIVLELIIAEPEEKEFKPLVIWIFPVIGLGLTIYYYYWSSYITEFMWYIVLTALTMLSTRGFLFARKQNGVARKRQYFYMSVLFIIMMEHGLWISSCCFWVDNSLMNPYYWFDFALSLGVINLIFALRTVVDK